MSRRDQATIEHEDLPSIVDPAEVEDRLRRCVLGLAAELHPRRADRLTVQPSSRLDRDLGYDSLGRVELLYRLERTFGVNLPEQLLGEAETVSDLLEAVLRAGASTAVITPPPSGLGSLEAAEAAPRQAATLLDVLDWHVRAHPERPHVLLSKGPEEEDTLTYGELASRAQVVACGLRESGIAPGDRVAIMLPTSAAFFFAFVGTLMAGGVPVPIYPPMRRSQIEEHLRRQAGILNNAAARILIAMPEARPLSALLRNLVSSLDLVTTVDALRATNLSSLPRAAAAADVALIQYTSGSTGDPKGVVLNHSNLLHNIQAMGDRMAAHSEDVFVSWLPLYHDMGLIGAWLGCLFYAVPTVIMPPLGFLARPERWLWAIHRHRATLSAAPNFAFELCVNKIEEDRLPGLDLSSLRFVANGAEPISPETIRRFTARFVPYGFCPQAMAPVYGLAESSVGLAFPPPDRLPIIDRIDREALTRRGEARPASAEDDSALEFVACGSPLPGHEVRVIDDLGRELGERHQGRLQFRGPSATAGYFRNPTKNKELFEGSWLDSGDLAYIAGGDIYVTGRVKDVIIRAGRNVYPQEVEEAVSRIEGLRKGCVAVFGSPDPLSGTERLVVLAETRETRPEVLESLHRQVADITLDILDAPPDEVRLVPPRTVPKTSSGKIRRAAARALFESGRIATKPRALWWQILRLALSSVLPGMRRQLLTLGDLIYAGYWWAVISLLGGTAWLLVMLLPHPRSRWSVVGRLARWSLRLLAIPLRVEGAANLPAGGCVVTANHSSYIDGLVISAAIPGTLSFVAKQELAAQFFAGSFLRRLGTLFVERMDREASVEDAGKVLAQVRAGARMVFFPEGTLTRMPGLLPFRLGAFQVACGARLPVVPVTLRGTRSIMRGDQWFPRRGAIDLIVGQPIAPDGEDFAAAIRLRDAVRGAMLDSCGEPDLED